MKRLRDSEARTPLMHKAQRLIDALPPMAESHERMLRIRRELDRPRGGLARMRRLPALVVAMIIGAFGASAFAAVRIFEVMRAPSADEAREQPATPALKRSKRSAPRAARLAAPVQPPAQIVEPAATPEASAEPAASHERPAHHRPVVQSEAQPAPVVRRAPAERSAPAHRAAAETREPQQPTAAKEPEPAQPAAVEDSQVAAATSDSELVHRAVKALRRDRDPALAARLLQENRARGLAGPLAEEALSLQIEAASALGDPRAQAFAREYLARYPHGRYLDVARGVLQDSAP